MITAPDPIKQLSALLYKHGPKAGDLYMKFRKYYEPEEAVQQVRLTLTFTEKAK